MKVLFVVLDTLRRDYLEPYGTDWVQTPNIARLAERSVVCDNHWVGSLPCMPARREFMTGRHNFLERGWGPLEPFDDVLPHATAQGASRRSSRTSSPTITTTSTSAARGTTTVSIPGSSSAARRATPGSAAWTRPPSPRAWAATTSRQNTLNRFAQREEHEFSGPRCVEHAVRWLDDNQGSDNWFLQLELFDPHEPFYVVPKYLEMYGDTWDGPLYDWPDYGVVQGRPGGDRAHPQLLRRAPDDDRPLARQALGHARRAGRLAGHDGRADDRSRLDARRARLLDEERDARLQRDRPHPADRPSAGRSSARAAASAALTQTTDIMPTFLDYFGAPVPPHLHGTSLRPALEADAGGPRLDHLRLLRHGGQRHRWPLYVLPQSRRGGDETLRLHGDADDLPRLHVARGARAGGDGPLPRPHLQYPRLQDSAAKPTTARLRQQRARTRRATSSST